MCPTGSVTCHAIRKAQPAQSSKLLIPSLIWVVASSSISVTLVALVARCIIINLKKKFKFKKKIWVFLSA